MPTAALEPGFELRSGKRHPVDHPVIVEHCRRGDLRVRIVNVSPEGFMACGTGPLGRGDRVQMRLPVVGRIEAHLVWGDERRAGFRFERLIRLGDFTRLLIAVQAPGGRASD